MPLKNCTILIIEDNLNTQKYLKELLEDDVQKIYQAYDGIKGLEVYEIKRPDIVITDINLPNIDGIKLLSKIKEKNTMQSVIIISGYDDKKNILDSINLGSNGFITKPIDVDLLYKRLNELASHIQDKNMKKHEMSKKIDELHKLAHYDPLTELPNRLLFDKELSSFINKAISESLEFSIFFIDLDNFKHINDTYGHVAGDFVLKTITHKISQVLLGDDIASRRSGDEFLVLLKNYPSIQHIKKLAYKILHQVSQSIPWKDQTLQLSCSIGISQFPHDSRHKDELISFADTAMYNAKKSGKDKYFIYSNLSL